MAQLTRSQRDQLQALRFTRQFTQREMADIMGCNQATVSRELRRNTTGSRIYYAAHSAQQRADTRRAYSYTTRFRWFNDPTLLNHVLTELHDGKSPDQVAGR